MEISNNFEEIEKQIITFNKLYAEYDEIYQSLAGFTGLTNSQSGVLYTIMEFNMAGNSICTQKDITDRMLYSKQSINSAVKVLIQKGYLELKPIEGNKKSKNIVFTKKGEQYLTKIQEIVEAENRAFSKLNNSERETLLDLFNQISQFLKEEFNTLLNNNLLT